MTKPTKPHRRSKREFCPDCELVALDSKGREVPMNHPSMTGVAYRQAPKHGGRCKLWPAYAARLRGEDPLASAMFDLDCEIERQRFHREVVEAEARKLEGP
jgi:hypothetical protein